MKYKTSKEKNFLEIKDNNYHGFTTNLKRNIKTDNNKQLDYVKEKNKINKNISNISIYSFLIIFFSILFLFLFLKK